MEHPTELQIIAAWWALDLPEWEARTILRRSKDPDVRARARHLAPRLFLDLPAVAQAGIVKEHRRRRKLIAQLKPPEDMAA